MASTDNLQNIHKTNFAEVHFILINYLTRVFFNYYILTENITEILNAMSFYINSIFHLKHFMEILANVDSKSVLMAWKSDSSNLLAFHFPQHFFKYEITIQVICIIVPKCQVIKNANI